MFKHLLVPVDGSTPSRQVIEKAIAIAEAFKSTVTVIYVIDPYAFPGVGTDFSYDQAESLSAATAEANEAIEAAKQASQAHGISVNASIVEGHAIYRGILETAQSVNADLLIMSTHGRHGLEKLVLGSVTSQVLSHAHLPVLVVRE